MTDYQRNRLIVYSAKIEKLEKNVPFFKKNFWKVISFGIILSFVGPNYKGHDHIGLKTRSTSVMGHLGSNYIGAVFFTLGVFAVFCVLGHLMLTTQNKNQLSRLRKKKQAILDEIAANENIV